MCVFFRLLQHQFLVKLRKSVFFFFGGCDMMEFGGKMNFILFLLLLLVASAAVVIVNPVKVWSMKSILVIWFLIHEIG